MVSGPPAPECKRRGRLTSPCHVRREHLSYQVALGTPVSQGSLASSCQVRPETMGEATPSELGSPSVADVRAQTQSSHRLAAGLHKIAAGSVSSRGRGLDERKVAAAESSCWASCPANTGAVSRDDQQIGRGECAHAVVLVRSGWPRTLESDQSGPCRTRRPRSCPPRRTTPRGHWHCRLCLGWPCLALRSPRARCRWFRWPRTPVRDPSRPCRTRRPGSCPPSRTTPTRHRHRRR